jgi:hypothetical protein
VERTGDMREMGRWGLMVGFGEVGLERRRPAVGAWSRRRNRWWVRARVEGKYKVGVGPAVVRVMNKIGAAADARG